MEANGNADGPEQDRVSEREARTELSRLLSDPQFRLTERNRNFLRFVTTEMFEGRAARVKAYAIAVDVFGRPPDFDPINDPIVRIEATRLRASLAQYYESRIEEGSVRIELPRGKYIPIFTKAPPQAEGPDDADAPADLEVGETSPGWRNSISKRRLVLSAIAASVAFGVIWLSSAKGPGFSEKPTVAVEMRLAGDQTDIEAGLIHDYLITALSQFQTLKLAAGETPRIAAADVTQAAAVSLFHSIRRMTNPYHVILKYHPTETARSVWWQIVNPLTGEAFRSGVERVFLDKSTEVEARRELVTHLATRFAGAHGVINGIELARELATPNLGNGCILRSAMAVESLDADELWEAGTCLDATLLIAPNDPDIVAEQAIVLLASEAPEASTELTLHALELANKAVALAPLSDRAGYAQMLAQFRNGQIEAAFVSGYRALELNPNNSLIAARLGAMLFVHGSWAAGCGLAIKAGMIEPVPHTDAGLTLALCAYHRGDFGEALLRVQQMGRPENYVANVLQIAASGQLGNATASREATDRLNARRNQFWTSFRSDMAARHYGPALIDELSAGLTKAGLALPQ